MLLVKTKLGVSKRHGIGLFADQDIPKGTATWEFHPKFDPAFSEEDIKKMSEPARQQFLHYAYFDHERKKYVLPFDDLRFINHNSKDPNISSTPDKDVAARDIKRGEELTCNYKEYEHNYFDRRNLDEEEFS